MKAALFPLLALPLAAQSAGQPSGLPACALYGTVVESVTGQPLRGVKLFAHEISESETAAYLRRTDAQGRFCFERLATGRYRLVAHRAGFLDQLYGALPGGQQGIELAVKADTKLPLAEIKLTPRPVLTGVVLHADGQPAPGTEVTVWQRVYSADGSEADSVESADTDDRGIFRFADLAPGTYRVSAAPNANAENRHSMEFLNDRGQPLREEEAATFYPATPDFAHARPIVLKAGQEVAGLAITLCKTPLRRISGRVRGAPPDSILYLDPESEGVQGKEIAVKPDGSFERSDVLPGKYFLEMHAQAADIVIRQEINLTSADAENLTVEPRETFTLPLVIHSEGLASAVDLQQFQITLFSISQGPVVTARPSPDGSLAFTHASAGIYRLRVYPLGKERYYLKRVTIAGQPQPRDRLDLRAPPTAPLELTFSSNVSAVAGRVSEMPSGAVTVLLVQPGHEEEAAQSTTDQTGTFHFDSIEPGKYRLFAIEGFDEGPWGSPELAAALRSVEIELGENENRSVTVPLAHVQEWNTAVKRFGQ
jgi:Carboxypeptidase regulatory-like domain